MQPSEHPDKGERTASSPDAGVIATFRSITDLLAADDALMARGRLLDVDCLLGPTIQPFHVAIRGGRIVEMTPTPVVMRSWRFSYRATARALAAYWQNQPRPGWHDLLALTKRGEAVLEGDLYPFMTHLQYFKDLLALPRRAHRGSGS
jgi:hypothetical protein